MKIKLIIADGSELVRLGLRTMFGKSELIDLVGDVDSSETLLKAVEKLEPDVVLIDYRSKGFSIDVIQKIHAKNLDVKFVGITPFTSGQAILGALKVGVESHVKNDCSVSEIFDAVISTYKGEKFFCGEMVDMMRGEKIDIDNIEVETEGLDPITLSDRELEIIKLIADGYTNAQISVVLYISNHTVNTHRKNIMKKLGVNNTAGIVMFAVKSNLVSPNQFMFNANT